MRCVRFTLAPLVLLGWQSLAAAQGPQQLDFVLQTGHTGQITSVALRRC